MPADPRLSGFWFATSRRRVRDDDRFDYGAEFTGVVLLRRRDRPCRPERCRRFVGGSGMLSATASSGLAVTLSVAPGADAVCSIADGSSSSPATIDYLAPGSCVIDANQAGNGTYAAAAQKTKTLTIKS